MRLKYTSCRLGLATLLVGCATSHIPAGDGSMVLVGAGPGAAPGAPPEVQASELAPGTSTLVVTIRWPQYAAQLLPTSATKVDLVVKDGSGNTLASSLLNRASGATSSSAALERLPAGQVTLAATAKNATNGTVATGTTTVTLVPNRRNQASLTLTPSNPPVITGFSPKAGGPGTQVSVTGTGFPTDETKMAVSLGGLPVPQGQTAAFGLSEFAFFVPAGATTSVVSIVGDGIKATSAAQFVTIGNISIAPTAAQTGASGSTTVFTVTALDTSSPGQAADGAPIKWSLSNVTGVNSSGGGGAPGDVIGGGGGGGTGGVLGTFSPTTGTTDSQGKATTTFTAKATGSAWVNVSAGTTLKATVSITIQ